MTPTQNAKGQHCGSENGNHGDQNRPVGTTVRSTCHKWLLYLAVTTRPLPTVSGSVAGARCRGFCFSIRLTVVVPRCSPARANVSDIFFLPIIGLSCQSFWTMWVMKSGKRFTGCCICTKASGPSSSSLRSQHEIVADVTRNARAVWASDQLRAALSSKDRHSFDWRIVWPLMRWQMPHACIFDSHLLP